MLTDGCVAGRRPPRRAGRRACSNDVGRLARAGASPPSPARAVQPPVGGEPGRAYRGSCLHRPCLGGAAQARQPGTAADFPLCRSPSCQLCTLLNSCPVLQKKSNSAAAAACRPAVAPQGCFCSFAFRQLCTPVMLRQGARPRRRAGGGGVAIRGLFQSCFSPVLRSYRLLRQRARLRRRRAGGRGRRTTGAFSVLLFASSALLPPAQAEGAAAAAARRWRRRRTTGAFSVLLFASSALLPPAQAEGAAAAAACRWRRPSHHRGFFSLAFRQFCGPTACSGRGRGGGGGVQVEEAVAPRGLFQSCFSPALRSYRMLRQGARRRRRAGGGGRRAAGDPGAGL